MDNSIVADELSRQAEGAGRNFAVSRCLGSEAKKIRGDDSRRKNLLVACGEFFHGGRVWQAFAKACLSGTVIDSLAQAFKHTLASKAGEGLRDCGRGQVAKVAQPPEPFSAPFDPAANNLHNSTRPGCCGVCSHSANMALKVYVVKFFCDKT